MAKGKPGKAKVAKTWASKTKTPKNRRAGIRAALHHSLRVISLQTPFVGGVPFVGVSSLRFAFEQTKVVAGHALVPSLLRSLKRGTGTYKSSGWKVINRRERNGKRRS